MKQAGGRNKDLRVFLASRLEKAEASGLGVHRRKFVRAFHAVLLVVRNFLDHKSFLRASALSFTTLLSIVPLLALAFAVLKGLGVQNSLEPIILKRFTVGSGEVVDKIVTYINNTKMGSVGAVGLAFLMVTVVSLLGSIEEAFNDIWGVKENRPLYRRFSDYLSVVVSGPLLILAALSITTSLQSQSVVLWLMQQTLFSDFFLLMFHVVPYLIVWVSLACLYTLMPNTKVRLQSALVGGVLAGTTWQVAQWGFIHFQIGVAKYNAIYGTLAALPVFMAWIYTSWLIVLFGVEVVAAHQSRKTFLHDFEPTDLSYATREATALVILLTVARAFYKEEPPWTLERLADERHIPLRTARRQLYKLVATGYLLVSEGRGTYYPARDLEHIRISTLLRDLKHQGGEFPLVETCQLETVARELSLKLERLMDEALEDLTLKDLVEKLDETNG